MENPGDRFRAALKKEFPLQIIGVVNAYAAIMAKHTGFKALYLSGAGVANASYGLPDLGMTSCDNVLEDLRRITSAVDLPVLVDIDTGWGNELTIQRAIKAIGRAGAAAIHIEDQPFAKRCGHRKGKSVISQDEMIERIQAAIEACEGNNPIIMARCDALSVEGFDRAVERCEAYVKAGAEMIFPEAFTSLEQYKILKKTIQVPILANITEFGQTPLFTTKELAEHEVDMALYPLSAWRGMNLAALNIFNCIRSKGTQAEVLETMQTREELYGFLNYEAQEHHLEKR